MRVSRGRLCISHDCQWLAGRCAFGMPMWFSWLRRSASVLGDLGSIPDSRIFFSVSAWPLDHESIHETMLPSKQFNMSEKGRAPARPALHRKGQSHAYCPVMRQKARQPNSQHKSYGRFRKSDGQAETKKKMRPSGSNPGPPALKHRALTNSTT